MVYAYPFFVFDVFKWYRICVLSNWIDIDCFKIFLILYADDIVLFANSDTDLQNSLNTLSDYCKRWQLVEITDKTKLMVFRKDGRLPEICTFYNDIQLEIVTKLNYLGIVFTPDGTLSDTQNTLSGQALKAILKMNKYLYKFTDMLINH